MRENFLPDASFDVVLSSMALHNIYNAGERQTALREIGARVAPGGRVLCHVRHTVEIRWHFARRRADGCALRARRVLRIC